MDDFTFNNPPDDGLRFFNQAMRHMSSAIHRQLKYQLSNKFMDRIKKLEAELAAASGKIPIIPHVVITTTLCPEVARRLLTAGKFSVCYPPVTRTKLPVLDLPVQQKKTLPPPCRSLPCRYFLTNTNGCRNGNLCPFLHTSTEVNAQQHPPLLTEVAMNPKPDRGKPSHIIESSTPSRTWPQCCYNCGSADHLNRDCPEGKSKSKPVRTYPREEPRVPQGRNGNGPTSSPGARQPPKVKRFLACFSCGAADHTNRDCPVRDTPANRPSAAKSPAISTRLRRRPDTGT